MDPLLCYQCLGVFNGGNIRATELRRCTRKDQQHPSYFHDSCAKGTAEGVCQLCQRPDVSAVALLCSMAYNKLAATDAKAVATLRPFMEEVVRLCKLPDAQSNAVPVLYEHRTCEVLYTALSRSMEDGDTAATAMRAVAALADTGYRDPQHRLGGTEGPYRLCRSLECHMGNERVVSAGLEAVGAIITADSKTLALFEEASVLGTAVKVIGPLLAGGLSMGSAAWPLPTLRTLRAVLNHNIEPQYEPSVAACSLLANMLKSCGSSDGAEGDSSKGREIRRYLCQVIADLAIDETSSQVFLDQKICRYICLLMTKARAEESTQVAACRAAGNMSLHNAGARTFLGEYLPALIRRMLDTHRTSEVVLETALRTTAALCTGNCRKNAESLGATAGLCETIVDSLRHLQEKVVLEAVRALSAMAFVHPENADKFTALQGPAALRQCREVAAGKGEAGAILCQEVDIALRAFVSGGSSRVAVKSPSASSDQSALPDVCKTPPLQDSFNSSFNSDHGGNSVDQQPQLTSGPAPSSDATSCKSPGTRRQSSRLFLNSQAAAANAANDPNSPLTTGRKQSSAMPSLSRGNSARQLENISKWQHIRAVAGSAARSPMGYGHRSSAELTQAGSNGEQGATVVTAPVPDTGRRMSQMITPVNVTGARPVPRAGGVPGSPASAGDVPPSSRGEGGPVAVPRLGDGGELQRSLNSEGGSGQIGTARAVLGRQATARAVLTDAPTSGDAPPATARGPGMMARQGTARTFEGPGGGSTPANARLSLMKQPGEPGGGPSGAGDLLPPTSRSPAGRRVSLLKTPIDSTMLNRPSNNSENTQGSIGPPGTARR